LAKEYGMGFWRVGRVLTVEAGSTGVVAMIATGQAAWKAIDHPNAVASLLRCLWWGRFAGRSKRCAQRRRRVSAGICLVVRFNYEAGCVE
jgi:hypothetical protein